MKEISAIEKQFDLIAGEYDSGRRKFIPCFDDYYEKTTEFAVSFMEKKPARILDLGSGTGLLAMYYYRYFPNAKYILADMAEEMLKVAGKRFENIRNIEYSLIDYTKELPEGNFDLVISALSIHHLEDEEKSKLFHHLKEKIPSGGWLINYDQFCCDSKAMDGAVNGYWFDHLYHHSGLTETELARWEERRKLDRECSVSEEIAMLKNCGFKSVECIYLNGKFAVIAAGV